MKAAKKMLLGHLRWRIARSDLKKTAGTGGAMMDPHLENNFQTWQGVNGVEEA